MAPAAAVWMATPRNEAATLIGTPDTAAAVRDQTLRLLRTTESHWETPASLEPPQRYEAAARTDPGCVRPRNEDHYLVAALQRSLSVLHTSLDGVEAGRIDGPPGLLVAVADGIG